MVPPAPGLEQEMSTLRNVEVRSPDAGSGVTFAAVVVPPYSVITVTVRGNVRNDDASVSGYALFQGTFTSDGSATTSKLAGNCELQSDPDLADGVESLFLFVLAGTTLFAIFSGDGADARTLTGQVEVFWGSPGAP